jgi:hypothetical protein
MNVTIQNRMFHPLSAILAVLLVLALAAGACAPAEPPVEIVSVTGPMPPINPGGPIIEIVLKNISTEPVVELSARMETAMAFTCNCDIAADNPLPPGESTIARITMISGGFSDTRLYLTTVYGKLKGGGDFSFTREVRITAPAQ